MSETKVIKCQHCGQLFDLMHHNGEFLLVCINPKCGEIGEWSVDGKVPPVGPYCLPASLPRRKEKA